MFDSFKILLNGADITNMASVDFTASSGGLAEINIKYDIRNGKSLPLEVPFPNKWGYTILFYVGDNLTAYNGSTETECVAQMEHIKREENGNGKT